ncbi:MAG: hypothetical protein SGI77_07600 [Pirellulaceae bacterium]|nr:hypothetical protein [Pirellulaceae bacterium]
MRSRLKAELKTGDVLLATLPNFWFVTVFPERFWNGLVESSDGIRRWTRIVSPFKGGRGE